MSSSKEKNSGSNKNKTMFVTVGTTLFEPLVAAVVTEAALRWMVQEGGYTHLIVQYGKGVKPVVVLPNEFHALEIELYDFKPSLAVDMLRADVIVCHAGAGTLMEALQLSRKVVTVINTALMDNHQTEVAHALAQQQLLYVVDTAADLASHWDAVERFRPAQYKGGDAHDVPRLLDSFFGFGKAA